MKNIRKLQIIDVEKGKIKSWFWIALWSILFMVMFAGVIFSDDVAARVSKNQMVLAATIPVILGAYAYSRNSDRKNSLNAEIGQKVLTKGLDGIPNITKTILKKGEQDDGSGREGD